MLVLSDVTLRRGVKVVLERASVTLQPGEKVGLVGRNGAGKSSLFALLTGRLQSDRGDVHMPPHWLKPGGLSEVAQDMPETEEGATDFVLQGDAPLQLAHQQLRQAELADDGEAIAHAHHAIQDAGGFDAPSRAQAMLMGLGFTSDQLDAPVNSFSGGWRMRLQLARALMAPAALMLLDEPTNHLDLDALVWLEAWLQRYDGTMIVISHDREFLDAVTNVTLHLEDTRLTRYAGNYTAFEEMRAERLMQAQANFAKQQERIAHLQKFIDRFKAKASKAKQAQSRVKALDRMERLAPALTSGEFQFEFREPVSLPNPMLAFADLGCGYPVIADSQTDAGTDTSSQHGRIIVGGIDRSVLAGQRIGILGANGQGKSTLVKTIAHDLAPLTGHITEGKGLVLGYFAQQELDLLSPADGPLMHMVRLARDVGPAAREQELRDFLGSFRFVGEMVNQAVGTLSGGEKARLVLAMLVWQRPNLLLLDEPTNHLDLTTREALSMALNEFEGTVMLVSHDRALLREVCDEFWLVAGGELKPFDGDLDDYQRWLLDQSREQSRGAKAKQRGHAPGAGGKRDDRKATAALRQQRVEEAKPLKKELNRIDHRLGVLFAERDALEARLGETTAGKAELAEAGRALKLLLADIETLEGRWLDLSTQLDALTADSAPG